MSDDLRQLQLAFLAAIRHGTDKNPQILEHIVSTPGFDAQQRFQVYRDSIRSGLLSTLDVIYPVCLRLVGVDFFTAMANLYCDQAQSYSPDLNDFGQDFADFIARFEPAKSLPYLSDVAALEWAVHRAQLGADFTPISADHLAKLQAAQFETVVFTAPANAGCLDSPYPIDKIWQANHNEDVETIHLDDDPCQLVVCMSDLNLRIQRVSASAYALLPLFNGQLSLSEVVDEALARDLDFPAGFQDLIRHSLLAKRCS